MATHAGMTTEEFEPDCQRLAGHRQASADQAALHRVVYQPMLELLAYLRASGFKTYIVSGGGIEFMRAFAERVYGMPPEQVIGSSIKTKYEVRTANRCSCGCRKSISSTTRGQAGGHQDHRPAADRRLRQFRRRLRDAGVDHRRHRRRLGVIVHHNDAEREYAYDRDSPSAGSTEGLDEAGPRGWTVVSMKNDWKTIFAPPRLTPRHGMAAWAPIRPYLPAPRLAQIQTVRSAPGRQATRSRRCRWAPARLRAAADGPPLAALAGRRLGAAARCRYGAVVDAVAVDAAATTR